MAGHLRSVRAASWRAAARLAGRRRTIAGFASLSAADYLVPVLPNEGMAVALALVQPRRRVAIGIAFALASALGAALMGTLLLGLADGAHRLGVATAGDGWERATAFVRRWGPWALAAASMFPSPPRAMVAATVLSGVPPAVAAIAVGVGKLGLYALLFSALARLPDRVARPVRPQPAWRWRLYGILARCAAHRRWLLAAASPRKN